jgi:BRCA1-associated protein
MERLECQLQETIKAKRKLEKKFDQATARLSKAENEICEEKEMNKYLRENQRELREKVERENAERERRHREEVQDLTDQVRDLMFYVETQQKMEKASDEQKQVNSFSIYSPISHLLFKCIVGITRWPDCC